MTDLPPLRYLTSADVSAAMPPLPERLALAETVLRGLAGDAELPPKIGIHPRPAGSFGHAMPAYLPGGDASGIGRSRGHEVGPRRQPEQRARHPGDPRHAAAQRPGHGCPDRDPRRRADHRRADGGDLGRRDPGVGAAGRRPGAAGRDHRRRGPGPEPRAGDRARAAGRPARGVRPRSGAGRGARRVRANGGRDRGGRRGARRARRGRGRGRRRHGGVVRRPARAPGDDRGLARARRRSSSRSTTRRTARPPSPATRGCSSSTTATSSSPTARPASSTATRTRPR